MLRHFPSWLGVEDWLRSHPPRSSILFRVAQTPVACSDEISCNHPSGRSVESFASLSSFKHLGFNDALLRTSRMRWHRPKGTSGLEKSPSGKLGRKRPESKWRLSVVRIDRIVRLEWPNDRNGHYNRNGASTESTLRLVPAHMTTRSIAPLAADQAVSLRRTSEPCEESFQKRVEHAGQRRIPSRHSLDETWGRLQRRALDKTAQGFQIDDVPGTSILCIPFFSL